MEIVLVGDTSNPKEGLGVIKCIAALDEAFSMINSIPYNNKVHSPWGMGDRATLELRMTPGPRSCLPTLTCSWAMVAHVRTRQNSYGVSKGRYRRYPFGGNDAIQELEEVVFNDASAANGLHGEASVPRSFADGP